MTAASTCSRFNLPVTAHYFSHAPAGSSPSRVLALQVAGARLTMRSSGGVFSKGALDDGSRLLIETFLAHDKAAPTICDLGCGWGAIGCAVAALRPQSSLWLCDINRHAASLARQNARDNALSNAHVWCGDGLAGVRSASFAAILCNPPVRAGNAVMQKLFDDGARCLKTKGALWIVLRTAQGAKSWQRKLALQWSHCDAVALKDGFRVLRCVR